MTEHKNSYATDDNPSSHTPSPSLKRKGATLIRGRVNEKIAQAATAETLRVTPDDVKVKLFDDQGKVGLDIDSLVRYDDVIRCAVRPDQSVYNLIKQARDRIGQKITTIAGLEVGKVNIALSGVKKISDEGGLQ